MKAFLYWIVEMIPRIRENTTNMLINPSTPNIMSANSIFPVPVTLCPLNDISAWKPSIH